MHYAIRHKTRLRYSASVSESFTEVRMQPRSETGQRCVRFALSTLPKARVMSHVDHLGNVVHHFAIPGAHRQLLITAETVVVVEPSPELPIRLDHGAWHELDQLAAEGRFWDYLNPSRFAAPSAQLAQFAAELGIDRRRDPLTLLRELNSAIFAAFGYSPQSTRVDSPIDEALAARQGVCQDFSHILIALLRGVGIPARYVSGYLFHRREDNDRSERDATHAWVEAWLPTLGWIGLDPTNNLFAGERHIRTAIGRDYADVPPTRGVYRGAASNSIEVGVRVAAADEVPSEEGLDLVAYGGTTPISDEEFRRVQQEQEQQ